MSKIFVDVGISLDGFMAGANRGPRNPLGDNGVSIHQWIFNTATFAGMLGLPGGEKSADDLLVKQVFARAGAYVLGRNMFDEGEVSWPENPPFRSPVFVLTHKPREPWVRKGGTTFYFVTDGIDSALRQAQAAAGDKDVRISGGADTICQYLNAGAVDELTLHVGPVMLGAGLRPFEHLAPGKLAVEQQQVSSSPLATHISYKVSRP